MKLLKIVTNPYTKLSLNILFAVFHFAIGMVTHSWWFVTVAAYYSVLAITRLLVLNVRRKSGGDHRAENSAKRMTGMLLMILSYCIVGVNILSALKDRGSENNPILMIAIATYTSVEITMAIIGFVKVRRTPSPVEKALRNVSLADACVSVYTMQRSMLVTFPGMEPDDIWLMNFLTGTVVWTIVLCLGINLIGGRRINMAKSKLVEANKKIAETVTTGYKKIEKGVVDGYKKIEQGVVDGYTKLEDKFVDAYLTKENETVEEAKKRLKEEEK